MADASANTTISNSLGKKFWKKISDDPSSGVTVVNEKLHLVIPPYYLDDLRKSVTSVIDCRLIRYAEELGGILAGYGNLVIEHPKADLLFDQSNIHVDVVGDFYIFNPEVNKELTGIVNRKSGDHIGCLVHGLFNIALPKPFLVNSEQWPGKLAKLHDNVRFKIGKVDLNSVVPYIEGRIIELIPNVESNSELRQRTSSDSGVSIASEESMNIATTPEASMDRKKSKLSLSQKKKTSMTVAIEVKNDAVEEDKKRKRNLSEGSTTQETPKNKRAKLANNRTGEPASEDVVPVENLATNVFAKLGGSPSHKQKKNQDASILVTASIAAEKNQESTIVLEDVGQRSIRELSPKKTASKKRKMEEDDSEVEEPIKSPKKSISKPNDDVESDMESNSDEDFRSSQKIPSSQKKQKLSKKLNFESEKEGSYSDEELTSSLKTPLSEKKPKFTKRPKVISEKVSSSDEDFVSSQKTPSQKKSKLAKKTDVEEKLVATPAKKTPAKKTPAKKTPAIKTPAKEIPAKKTPAKEIPAKETPAKETPAKKTPSQPAKEASHKKSKTSVEKQSKKKAVVEDSDSDVDPELLIQEVLNGSRFAFSPDSTTIEKPVKQKKTPMSKTKLVDSEKKSQTAQKPPISTPVSLPVKETKTATSVKKNAKESSSGLKALSSEKNQETAEMNQEVLSTKKTPSSKKTSKIAPAPENALNVSLKEKKIKIEPSRKRSKSKKDADKEADSEHEEMVAEILKSVQMTDKKSKSKTKKTANS
ncbi:nucleolar protein dao-5-like isoform X2 [Daphnia pulex]|uniref:nucleolar protein dao-5-like isoform X2 n=1 Tax=Daphnia pulex TaxID=6669 RepID=UPI001EDD2C75|nr:nucleolar protein dao-5-like isoform X2 [Daphnia pulex]